MHKITLIPGDGIGPEVTAETKKIITKPACERIVDFAVDYAKKNDRKKITGVHKANIMKLTDGLFLDVTYTWGWNRT